MFRSHLLQIMQNYFDSTDVRSRENPVSLEAQLLNLAAAPLEDLSLRINRESALALQTTPLNIDNGGVYYAGRVPQAALTGPFQTTLNSVVGKLGSSTTTLSLYDDRLPIPSRISVGDPVPLANPLIFTVVGFGDSQNQSFATQYVAPGAFPIPNKLTVWADQIGLNQLSVTLTVVGETAPQPVWFAERRKTTEVLTINSEGAFITRNRWAQIDRIAIRGLPLGVRLRGWSIPFAMPACSDPARPYTTPEDRDVLYPRYWQISNSDNLLKEMYRAGGFTGLESVNSYLLTDALIDVAVEPNTYGLYAISQSKLYYTDRREVMPNLAGTGLSVEPLFGLQVQWDISKVGAPRYVILSGIPYARAQNIFQYRYIVNGVNSILPDGSLGPIDRGWRGGAPATISIPLLNTGDYVFKLEMQDASGLTSVDVVPWKSAAFTPLKTIDISAVIDIPRGLAFDSYGTLWAWNGSFAIPITVRYDGYIFDANTQMIFTTDQWDSLQVS